jgi:hypothetical protein
MRRLFPAVVLLGLFAAFGPPAQAQITLVPGQAFLTPRLPEFIAAADFNHDGYEDAAVINPASDKVSVLYGTSGATFSTVLDLAIGRRAQQIATGDLNEDGLPDIAIVTNVANSVYVVDSAGNGTFNLPPRGPFVVGKKPVDIAVGNFDNKNGLDMVTADLLLDRVTVLLNQGRNRGFQSLGDFPVGHRPKAVAVGDFNNDGLDDIVAVNTGQQAADDISVLLNNGVGSFNPPTGFVVGAKAKSISVADVNNDGAPDILVLNSGLTATVNTFTVSVLLDQTTTVGGKVKGTGFFTTLTPMQVTCPTTIGGVPIFCSPNVITTGDFDADGNEDFALTFQTLPQLGQSSPTAGLISAYSGAGDGTFTFATQVSVGLRPNGIVAADFNGDTIPDLATAEEGDRTVRIVLSLPPVKRCPGELCNLGKQCIFPDENLTREGTCPGDETRPGFCVDGTCCTEDQCPAGQFCNIPGSEGSCHAPLDNGGRCTLDSQCESGFCVDGFCCGSRACPAGTFCNTGTCLPPADNGLPCNQPQQCQSSFCVDGICCSDSRCPVGQRCDISGEEGVCSGPGPIGRMCTVPEQCESGFCVDGVCCVQESCPAGEACNVAGNGGFCTIAPTPTPTPLFTDTPTPTFTPTPTPTPQPNGANCATGGQCTSGFCVNGACCSTNSCPAGQACNLFFSAGTCASPGGVGQECRLDSDCASGNCQAGSPPRCAAARTPTPTATATPLPNGVTCAGDTDCQSGFCEDSFCCESPCPSGEFCDVQGREGTCSLPKPGPGQECDPNTSDPCDGGLFCNPDGICCDTEDCPTGERCDVFGFEGTCSPPLMEGDECEKNIDCEAGLECRFDPSTQLNLCQAPRTPTPTLIPPPSPTRAGSDVVVHQSSGGGCSIGADGSGGAWILVLVPFLLWVRRYAPVPVRRRRK